jgi:hypothetical protein
MSLTRDSERWTTSTYFPEENMYEILVNGGSDPYFYTVGLTEAIPERNITLSYEYKTDVTNIAVPSATGFNFEYFVSTPNPDGAKTVVKFIQFSNEYKSHAVELKNGATQWNWGEVGHRFRMDTGTNDTYNIVGLKLYIKNLRIDVYEL